MLKRKALPQARSPLVRQSLADPVADVPSIGPSADRHLQDSHWDVSDAHHRGQSSAESEDRHTQQQQSISSTA